MRPYEIFITSASSAMIEFIPDTISIHHLKKKMVDLKYYKLTNLHQFYRLNITLYAAWQHIAFSHIYSPLRTGTTET